MENNTIKEKISTEQLLLHVPNNDPVTDEQNKC